MACSLALLGLVAACSGTLLPKPAPPPARFTLDDGAAAVAATTPSPGAPDLVVALLRAAAGLDSRRMLYQRRPLEIEAFAFHEWAEPPAQLLAPLLLRALQAGGGFRAVLPAASAGSSAPGSWRLETELLRLQQDFATRPSQVRISLRAVVLDGGTRRAIAWREFDVRVDAASDDPVAGVQAANEAVRRLLAELAAFCAEQGRAAPR
ncbi:ABC-type transport auxiliary lipoprotein family protein [Rubrivivax sp. A210]|uniref:ABC-type transport auxiliary lipoprotein family protein n=1 Tax=Rubrivivax sp. A210 TaxID=2772301 RepID=UPI00191AC4EF|nr:ABC-type transport auxiliary lipoprotein family protein [Rubrivivax sp. A210]